MTSGVVFNFGDDPGDSPDGPTLTANSLVAAITHTATLAPYGRAVWPHVRDTALGWRRRGTGVAMVHAAGLPDALWWAAVDGAFEARGGVVDMVYRAMVIDAVLSDRPGPVVALGSDGDPWLAATTAVCAARSRDLRIRSAPRSRPLRTPAASRLRRASLIFRRAAGAMRGRSARAELLVVLAHGRMARRTPSGRIADVYTRDFLDPLAARSQLSTISLEAPGHMDLADLAAIASGAYRPWLAWSSLSELRASAARREGWATAIRQANVLSLIVSGIDLGPALDARAVPLAARGLALAELYSGAFRRALDEIAPRAILSTEGHSNVGRVLGSLAPTTPLLAPQAGVIGRDAVTNAAYDRRGLVPLSDDGRSGCPAPSVSLLWGAHYGELLTTLGHSAGSISVTGLPRQLSRNGEGGDEVLFIAGSNDDLCAFASDFYEEVLTIRAVARATARRVRVRLHPTHHLSRYRAYLGPEFVLSHPSQRRLEDDLATARVAVGKSSTALLEAAAAGWPVVVVNLGPTPDLTGFGDAGLLLIEQADGLLAALASASPAESAAASLAWPRGSEAIARTVDHVAAVATR